MNNIFESLKELPKDSYKLYSAGDNNFISEKYYVLVTHELTRTGAPMVLKDMAIAIREMGYQAVFISPKDGAFALDCQKENISVIIDYELEKDNNSAFDIIIQNAEAVIVNTVVLDSLVKKLMGSEKRVLWWIHEGASEIIKKKSSLPHTLSENVKVLCVSDYVNDSLTKHGFKYDGRIFPYYVNEFDAGKEQVEEDDTVTFYCVGTFGERKNQRLLLDAIAQLSVYELDKSQFIFAGIDSESIIAEEVRSAGNYYKNIIFLGELKREDLYKTYREGGVLICPSKEDPLPVVVTENMFLGNVSICSSETGSAKIVDREKCGFVFPSDNVDELVKLIQRIINNQYDKLAMRHAARETFYKYYTKDIFVKNLMEILSET